MHKFCAFGIHKNENVLMENETIRRLEASLAMAMSWEVRHGDWLIHAIPYEKNIKSVDQVWTTKTSGVLPWSAMVLLMT